MADGELLKGQQLDQELNAPVSFTEQKRDRANAEAVVDAVTANTEVIPLDAAASTVRTYVPPAAAILASVITFPSTANIQFPDVLVGIAVTYNPANASGSDLHPITQMDAVSSWAAGGSGTAAMHPHATASGSASIMPDVTIDIRQVWASNLPVRNFVFYMADGFNTAALLARLTTLAGAAVTAWPVFRPVAHTLVLKGQQKSAQATADTRAEQSGSDVSMSYSWEWGQGQSHENSVSVKSVRIPPTIHGAITIADATSSASFDVTVDASTIDLTQVSAYAPGNHTIAAIPNALTFLTTVNASVTPSTLAATTPTALPTSGISILDLRAEAYKWGYTAVHAQLFDFANLA